MGELEVENALKVQRAIRDLTQAELAGRAGITRVAVNAIEGGRMTPSILLALKLAEALDLWLQAVERVLDRGDSVLVGAGGQGEGRAGGSGVGGREAG